MSTSTASNMTLSTTAAATGAEAAKGEYPWSGVGVVLAEGTLHDIDGILDAKYASARAAYEPLGGRTAVGGWFAKRGTAAYVRARILDPACRLLVATDAGTGRVLGSGCILETGAGPYLTDVYVSPGGHGVGRAIVESLLAWADVNLKGSARCYVIAENAPAVRFFSGCGFVEVSRGPNPEFPGELLEMHRAAPGVDVS